MELEREVTNSIPFRFGTKVREMVNIRGNSLLKAIFSSVPIVMAMSGMVFAQSVPSPTAILPLAILKATETKRLVFPAPLETRQQPPSDKPVVLVVEQKLSDFLLTSAHYNGLELRFSGPVNGILREKVLPFDILGSLKELQYEFDLSWFMLDDVLFVSTARDLKSHSLKLGTWSIRTFQSELAGHGIPVEAYQLRILKQKDILEVIAPASHLDGILSITNIIGRGMKNAE